MFFEQGCIVKVACLQYVTEAVVCLFLEDLEASHKISLHDQLLSWVYRKRELNTNTYPNTGNTPKQIQFSLMRSCRRESCSHMAETAPTLFVPPGNWFPCCQLPPAAFSLFPL